MSTHGSGVRRARHPSLADQFDGAVRIVEHDPAWGAAARSELSRIARALGAVALRLEHVGSTAVPGLAAKPVLDLQVSVAAIGRRERYVAPLEALGYLFVPDPESPDYHFFALPAQRPRTHHLHVCEAGSAHELRHLAVRELLRADAAEAARYGALKRALVTARPFDRLAYIAGKEDHLRELEQRALEWAARAEPSVIATMPEAHGPHRPALGS